MKLIDTHAHIMDPRFDNDREDVIKRAMDNGVNTIIEVACQIEEWELAVNLALNHQNIFCALGIHPLYSQTFSEENWSILENLCRNDKVKAVGETGLDFYHAKPPYNFQEELFIKHIELALALNKPLSIHCRNAYPRLIELLTQFASKKTLPNAVVHCFSGTKEEAKKLVGFGFFLGIDGPITYPKSLSLKESVFDTSLDKLLLETDCPYLPPQKFRGQRNEPSYISMIASEIAVIKNVSLELVIDATTKNAQKLFNI